MLKSSHLKKNIYIFLAFYNVLSHTYLCLIEVEIRGILRPNYPSNLVCLPHNYHWSIRAYLVDQ